MRSRGKTFTSREGKGRRLPVRYCQGKVCYDKRTAQTARNRRQKFGSGPLRIYPCPRCNTWHLTSHV